MPFTPKNWIDSPSTATPLSAAALEDLEGRVTDYADAEIGGLQFADGNAATPGVTFAADPTAGMFRLGTNRLGFSTNGVLSYYVQTDGCLIVPDVLAGDPTNLTSGTSPGTIVTGSNRAYRTINSDQNGTIRLLTTNSSDEISIGSGGVEGGPASQLAMRNTQAFEFSGATAAIKVMGLADATSTVFLTEQEGQAVPRVAMLGTGRTEYSDGTASADVVVIPRNNPGEWRLGAGDMLLNGAIEIDGALNHDGTLVGFYGTTPTTKPTGVAVTAGGIHAALVTLGLIAA